jgi:invasion protein IalB
MMVDRPTGSRRQAAILALGLMVAFSAAAAAQVRAPEPTPDSTTETFGDWTVVCAAPRPGSSERVCEVGITMSLRGQAAPIARIAFGRQANDKPMRIVALVPPNVSIGPGVTISPEPGKPGMALVYKTCVPRGCVADADLGKDQVQSLRNRPKPGQIAFMDATGKPMTLELPFKGLDEALDALAKR